MKFDYGMVAFCHNSRERDAVCGLENYSVKIGKLITFNSLSTVVASINSKSRMSRQSLVISVCMCFKQPIYGNNLKYWDR